jgi:tetratricopeptide (TPR) repeat protein
MDALYPNTYTNRGCVYHVLGRYAEALAEYAQALRLGSSEINSRARNNRGLLYLALNQPERALQDFQQSLELDPQYANAYVNLGLAHAFRDDYSAAVSSFDRALALNPHQVLAYHNRGYVFHRIGRVQEALADYTSALGLDPFLVQGYVNRSVLYTQLGRRDEAEDDMRQAAERRPESLLDTENLTATMQVSQPDPHVTNTGQGADLLDAPFRARRREQQLMEKMLGDGPRSQKLMPLQPVVEVEHVAYATWLHERVLERQKQGERLTQLTLDIRIVEADTLEEPLPDIDECQLILDEDAMSLMEAEGITSIFELEGRWLLLENDNPDDPQCPLRLYNIM